MATWRREWSGAVLSRAAGARRYMEAPRERGVRAHTSVYVASSAAHSTFSTLMRETCRVAARVRQSDNNSVRYAAVRYSQSPGVVSSELSWSDELFFLPLCVTARGTGGRHGARGKCAASYKRTWSLTVGALVRRGVRAHQPHPFGCRLLLHHRVPIRVENVLHERVAQHRAIRRDERVAQKLVGANHLAAHGGSDEIVRAHASEIETCLTFATS